MSVWFAQVISVLLNPVIVMVFVPFLLVYRTTHNASIALSWTWYSLAFLIAIALFILYGVKKKFFTDLDVSRREHRPLLFVIGIIFILFYLLGIFLFHGPKVLY